MLILNIIYAISLLILYPFAISSYKLGNIKLKDFPILIVIAPAIVLWVSPKLIRGTINLIKLGYYKLCH